MSTSVERLHMATVKLAGQFNPPTYADTTTNVYAYLIRSHSNVVLVDTGIGVGNRYIDDTFEPQRTSMIDQLARFGVEPTDVDIVVNSHLHFDHCGNNRLFSHAEFFVQEAELETARKERYTIRSWFDFDGAQINPVRGDLGIIPGISIVPTPGHTPGHQSLVVETDGARVVIAAQAAFTAHEYRRGGDPDVQAHDGLQRQYVESIARLKLIEAEGVYFSHDATVVTTLDERK